MLKQYIKMAIRMLKENSLVSTISILGTALSIAMIMVVILIYQVQLTGFPPESNRDRILYVLGTQLTYNGAGHYKGSMSYELVKECFYTLQTPEAVSAFYADKRPVSLPDKQMYTEYTVKYTDDGFWKMFDFHFVEGKPFTEADFESGIRAVVITDKLARTLYGTTDVVGNVVVLSFMEYTIRGVVREVSEQATEAFGDLWIPFTTNPYLVSQEFGLGGVFNVCMLAKDKKDFAAIRTELDNQTKRVNVNYKESQHLTVQFMPDGPITRTDIMRGSHGFKWVSWKEFFGRTGALLLFLLLVPALNLTGVTQSSVQRRRAELGVRKSFGATPRVLWMQLIEENLVIACVGGVIGFGLSFLFLHFSKTFLLNGDVMLSANMLLQPFTFIVALLFVLLLNLLSTAIPAIRITRLPIVNSLKENE